MSITSLTGALPLIGHTIVRTTDAIEAFANASNLFGKVSTKLDPDPNAGPRHFEYHLNMLPFGHTQLVAFEQVLGARGVTEFSANSDCYVLEIPILGTAKVTQGGETYELVPGRTGVITSPSQSTTWIEDGLRYRAIALHLDRKLIDFRFQLLTGQERFECIEFEPLLDFRTVQGQGFLAAVVTMFEALDGQETIFRNELSATLYEDFLINVLLTAFPHSHNAALRQESPQSSQKTVQRAEDYFHKNADHPITMADVAKAIGVSVRSLQRIFQTERHSSPMRVLKGIRLDRARTRLMTEKSHTTVTQVALTSGFSHLGAFSSDYRKRFGESPSETINRHK
jgi:AraC-like DNA-binding protein